MGVTLRNSVKNHAETLKYVKFSNSIVESFLVIRLLNYFIFCDIFKICTICCRECEIFKICTICCRECEKLSSFLNSNDVNPRILIKCCEYIILHMHSSYAIPNFPNKYEDYMEILDLVEEKLTQAISTSKSSEKDSPILVSTNVCQLLKNLHYIKVRT